MKQKKITIILTSILVILFISLFIVQHIMFYVGNPTFPNMIEEVITYSSKNQWDKADETLTKVEEKWNKAQTLIAIKYADQDYSFLKIGISRLRGAINTKDRYGAQREGKACILLFKNITSVSPNP
ncbi:protein of unknown function [Clostridium acidisoli DSM 12555]|uniref:DUF4363 family protein n=1 Tax=Clostridium acidisoli DSM 12555 TaxID=1121291 RepID=A0A1W1WWH0_9CLOT|nr:DUF4363 family protein [Clostridium acidisoli]SMC16062.1 protein of unknown function [Clostridium acidisoli DSM 12555]